MDRQTDRRTLHDSKDCAYASHRAVKIGGVWARGASIINLGPPVHFCKLLKLATSNLVHTLGLGLAQQKTTFKTKIGGGLGQGSIQKNWDPILISATVEASSFKFGIPIGFGTSLPKNNV